MKPKMKASLAAESRKRQFDRDLRWLIAHITICAEVRLEYGEQMVSTRGTSDIVPDALRMGFAAGWNRLNCHNPDSAKSAAHALLAGVNCHEEAARLLTNAFPQSPTNPPTQK